MQDVYKVKSNKRHCQEDRVWNVLSAVCLRLSAAAIGVKHTGVALCSEHQQDEGCLVTCWRVSSDHPGVEGSRRVSSRSKLERRLLLSHHNARHRVYSSAAGIAVCDVYHEVSSGSTASLEGAQKHRVQQLLCKSPDKSYLPGGRCLTVWTTNTSTRKGEPSKTSARRPATTDYWSYLRKPSCSYWARMTLRFTKVEPRRHHRKKLSCCVLPDASALWPTITSRPAAAKTR